ncbi:acyltransferase [Acidovorax sp. 1608163]|uniref:acyltransferase family protein n=1 Tax=Acidovorax sp. 1608163 TaxID=2478662 RepID=UPI000EF68C5D|nr:acyltransferase family protein [Acidovorax sp. 1608163]AYM95890.1 acyltransferase [Acidovorax sp. 1608163]
MTTSTLHLSHPKYRPDIDGLRAVAVLSVVAFHAFPAWMKGGFIGVDVFFVISGFLISTIIFENLDRGTFSFAEFYARRVKRIFPALLLVLIASYAFGWFALLADEYKQLGQHIAAGAGFVSNFVLWGESGYFDNSAETKPLLHLWSLGIEEQFYIVWPFVLWLAWRKKFNLLTLTILVAFISFYLNIKGIRKDAVATFYSPQTRFWELLSGSLLAWLALYKKNAFANYNLKIDGWLAKIVYRETVEVDGRTLSNVISFFGSLLLVFGFYKINKDVIFPGRWAVIPVLGAVMIILAGPKAFINKNILSNKIAVWFGLISFPLYLWHWPLLSFARIVESEVPGRNIRIAAVVLSIVLAWLTYKLIERPIRFGVRDKIKVPCLLLLMALIAFVGYNAYARGGLKFRDSVKLVQLQTEDLNFKFKRMDGWLCDSYKDLRCYYSGEKPSVVVLGDSHAPTIYSGLREFYSSVGVGVAVFGGGDACPPLLNVVSKINKASDTFGCISKITAALKIIISDPSIKEVVLASRGPLYTTSNGFGSVENYGEWVLHYENEEQGIRSNSEVFFGALGTTFDVLTSAGKKVTYLIDVPELGFDIKSCLSLRPITITAKVKEPCAILRSEYDDRTRDFRGRLAIVLESRPSVNVVDLSKALCDEKYCYGSKDGALLYTDDDHLSHRGSEYVVHRLWDKFR